MKRRDFLKIGAAAALFPWPQQKGQHSEIKNPCGEVTDLNMSELCSLTPPEPISTGFKTLDECLGGGFRKGRIYAFCGRPGGGKTLLARKIGDNLLKENSRFKGAFISDEYGPTVRTNMQIFSDKGHTPYNVFDLIEYFDVMLDDRHPYFLLKPIERAAIQSRELRNILLNVDAHETIYMKTYQEPRQTHGAYRGMPMYACYYATAILHCELVRLHSYHDQIKVTLLKNRYGPTAVLGFHIKDLL
jgi:hypothetical protein